MDAIFQELKNLVLEAERDPERDTGEAAVILLRQWLDTNTETLLRKKGLGEYNGTMMQWFHWYIPADGEHWNRLRSEAPALVKAGITGLWLPPANKGIGGANDVGYGTYDLYDLGEFDQKGTVRTKYGTKSEYLAAVKECRDLGLQVYADTVFNHKMAADFEEDFEAIPFDPSNRYNALGDARPIRSWTGFNFPGRNKLHSSMDWHWWHFDSVDYNSLDPGFKAIWRMRDKQFEGNVDLESGNYDYLMGCDLDINHPEVRGELKRWGEWMLDHVGVDGFRLDAIKHINSDYNHCRHWNRLWKAGSNPLPTPSSCCGGRAIPASSTPITTALTTRTEGVTATSTRSGSTVTGPSSTSCCSPATTSLTAISTITSTTTTRSAGPDSAARNIPMPWPC